MNDEKLSEHEVNLRDLAAMFVLNALVAKRKEKKELFAAPFLAYDIAHKFMEARAELLAAEEL